MSQLILPFRVRNEELEKELTWESEAAEVTIAELIKYPQTMQTCSFWLRAPEAVSGIAQNFIQLSIPLLTLDLWSLF